MKPFGASELSGFLLLLLVCGVGVFARSECVHFPHPLQAETRNSPRENIKLMPITSQHPPAERTFQGMRNQIPVLGHIRKK